MPVAQALLLPSKLIKMLAIFMFHLLASSLGRVWPPCKSKVKLSTWVLHVCSCINQNLILAITTISVTFLIFLSLLASVLLTILLLLLLNWINFQSVFFHGVASEVSNPHSFPGFHLFVITSFRKRLAIWPLLLSIRCLLSRRPSTVCGPGFPTHLSVQNPSLWPSSSVWYSDISSF
jgi:hypothetical protein